MGQDKAFRAALGDSDAEAGELAIVIDHRSFSRNFEVPNRNVSELHGAFLVSALSQPRSVKGGLPMRAMRSGFCRKSRYLSHLEKL